MNDSYENNDTQETPAPQDLTQYPDDLQWSEGQKRALEMATSGKTVNADHGALPMFAPEPDFDHLAPPKRHPVKVFLIVLLIIALVSGAGYGGWYYWWTEHATFEYQLQPAVILDGQSVLPDQFLPRSEIEQGIVAVFQNPEFTPVPGPMTIPLTLELGLRSLETEATLYVLTPRGELAHEFRNEAPELQPIDFLTNAAIARGTPFEIIFTEPPQPLNRYDVGEHTLRLALNGAPFEIKLTVTDTTPPFAVPEDVMVEIGTEVLPFSFVTEMFDHSDIASVAFIGENENEPFIVAQDDGIVEVEIIDIFGNSNVFASSLIVIKNEIPPELTGIPVAFEAMVNTRLSYPENIAAYDDFGREIDFTVDESEVDFSTSGRYFVTFTAEDMTGLIATLAVPVYVIDIDPEEVNTWVDNKLNEIITGNLSQEEIVRAIFLAVRSAVYHRANVYDEWTGSVYTAAHFAIHNRQGDYYHFYALSEIMLTRAGILNMRIERVDSHTDAHFWNLISFDGGNWYHYDSMRIVDNADISAVQHMFTQKQAEEIAKFMAASSSFGKDGFYDYDPDLFYGLYIIVEE